MTRDTVRPTPVPVLRRLVFDGWRGMLGWIIGIAAVLGLYLPLYPSMASEQMTDLINNLPSELVDVLGYNDITSGAGYTQATFFGLLGFALLVIAATSWGATFIAGAEETGRLEITLAHAVGPRAIRPGKCGSVARENSGASRPSLPIYLGAQ